MLSEFLHSNRSELIERCQAKAAKRNQLQPTFNADGIPQFITQLVHTFQAEERLEAVPAPDSHRPKRPSLALVPGGIPSSAAKHGEELHRQGLSVDQVVHDYGDLCQALTELAMERDVSISVDEFHTFNRCLDDAIAGAVTAFSRRRKHPATRWNAMDGEPASMEQQARELLKSAIVSFAAIRAGQVGLKGTTSSLHERSLLELQELLDVVLADPRDPDAEKGVAP